MLAASNSALASVTPFLPACPTTVHHLSFHIKHHPLPALIRWFPVVPDREIVREFWSRLSGPVNSRSLMVSDVGLSQHNRRCQINNGDGRFGTRKQVFAPFSTLCCTLFNVTTISKYGSVLWILIFHIFCREND